LNVAPDGKLREEQLRQLISKMNRFGQPNKGDIEFILSKFDLDRDGAIGLEDFKLMTLLKN
jgi:Ca2+-binding EF-hand superfamily protein